MFFLSRVLAKMEPAGDGCAYIKEKAGRVWCDEVRSGRVG